MKKKLLSIFILTAIVACNNNENQLETNTNLQTENTKTMNNEERIKIEELLKKYENSLNTSDAKLAQSLYTDNGVFMPTEAPSGIGAEGILKSYEFVFSQIKLNIEFKIDEIQVEGNMAYAVTGSNGTVKILANGVEVPESNRELFVFEKVDGNWKIARYMFNKTSPKN
jgi:uncharacterized protein (TIGR02246 family)